MSQTLTAPVSGAAQAAATRTARTSVGGSGPPGAGSETPAFSSVLDHHVARTAHAEGQHKTTGDSGGRRSSDGHRAGQRPPLAQVGGRGHDARWRGHGRLECDGAHRRSAGCHARGRADAAGAGHHGRHGRRGHRGRRGRSRGREPGGDDRPAHELGPWGLRAAHGRRRHPEQQLHPRHRQTGIGASRVSVS